MLLTYSTYSSSTVPGDLMDTLYTTLLTHKKELELDQYTFQFDVDTEAEDPTGW